MTAGIAIRWTATGWGRSRPHEVDGVCLRCHYGVRASRDSHPIGRRFNASDVVLPAGWPAAGGRLGCPTCHDTRAGMHQPERPEKTPHFLRDPANGSLLTFCAKCHVPQTHRRFNPHVMLRDGGEAIRQVCGLCHRGLADQRNRMVRLGEPELRADEVGCAEVATPAVWSGSGRATRAQRSGRK